MKYDVTKLSLSRAFNSFTPSSTDTTIEINERHFHKLKNVPRLVRFYYVNTGTKANKQYTNQQWLDIFNFHRITRLIMNDKEIERSTEVGEMMHDHVDKRFSRTVIFENTDREEINQDTDQLVPRENQRDNSNLSYFVSSEAKKLFCPSPNESVLDCIYRRITILSSIIEKDTGIDKYVMHAKEHPLTHQQIQDLTYKCVILRACYYSAIRDMATVQNWGQIVSTTLEKMSEYGIKRIKNERTVRNWHHWFKQHESFPHPNHYVQMQMKVIPKVFEVYPEVEELLNKFASKNLETLSSESLALHIQTKILPEIYEKHVSDQLKNNMLPLTMDDFMAGLNLSTVSPNTAWRWLQLLGYKHGCNKKCYYNDRHEDPENIKDRGTYIDSYFNYDLHTYHWVQILEEEAIRLENEQDVELVNAFHPFTKEDGTKMREYHIDTHPILMTYVMNKRMNGDLSVRKQECDRPLIIVGQDECVVKQYSFSSQSWQGKDGEKKLLPKSDGYSLMMSAFCDRCFGLGLDVSEQQLHKIIDRRSNGETSNYFSEEAAMEIYGTKNNYQ